MSTMKDKIAAVRDRGEAVEHIDEWDMDLLLLSLNTSWRAKVIGWISDADGDNMKVGIMILENAPALLVGSLYDPTTRERIFDDTPEDIAILAEKSTDVIQRLVQRVMELSGLSEEALVEEKKDSSGIPKNGSTES